MELERVTMVRAKDLSEMDITYDVELKKIVDRNFASAKIGILFQGDFVEAIPSNYAKLKALGLQLLEDGATGQTAVETSPGVYSTTRPTDINDSKSFGFVADHWVIYGEQLASNTVVTEEIFQLDFNKFLKVKGSFRPLYQKLSTF